MNGCLLCDVLVEGVVLEANTVGLAVVNAGGLVVRSSDIINNAAGITLRSSATEEDPPQRAAYVVGNRILDNANPELETVGLPDSLEEVPSGVGVWVAGGAFDVIEGNEITGHQYGVAVTWGTFPARQVRVSNNHLGGSEHADLAWDGAGANVCFSNNTTDYGEPTTEPLLLQTTASCELPATAGVPTPTVSARIWAHAVTRYYCQGLPAIGCMADQRADGYWR